MSRPRYLVVQCAALGWSLFDEADPVWDGLRFQPLRPPLPAVTCVAQASFRTAAPPSAHGMVANGRFYPELARPMFWEQSAALVAGPRIWDDFRAAGGTVGLMFWQQSLGENVDLVLSPRPIHKHSGGMLQDCYSQPAGLYDELRAKVGRGFKLMHYWGPLASRKSSEWIVDATLALLAMPERCPDLLLTYLPHLDYDLQRHGPAHPKAQTALRELRGYLRRLAAAAKADGRELLVWGDYAIHAVNGPAIFPNRALREAGHFRIRSLRGMAYPDFFSSPAFAIADHEIAHVHVRDAKDLPAVQTLLAQLDGVETVLARAEAGDLNHPHAGDLIAFARPGRWFAYPWWTDPREAPDFATHVDIHNKPGFDPCELFFGKRPWHVSQDTTKVGGSHGALGPQSQAAWACTDPHFRPSEAIPSLTTLAKALRARLA
jgi:predicted AlkP superfamily pyrophosphatase or phosphodiesterase